MAGVRVADHRGTVIALPQCTLGLVGGIRTLTSSPLLFHSSRQLGPASELLAWERPTGGCSNVTGPVKLQAVDEKVQVGGIRGTWSAVTSRRILAVQLILALEPRDSDLCHFRLPRLYAAPAKDRHGYAAGCVFTGTRGKAQISSRGHLEMLKGSTALLCFFPAVRKAIISISADS